MLLVVLVVNDVSIRKDVALNMLGIFAQPLPIIFVSIYNLSVSPRIDKGFYIPRRSWKP